MKPWVWRRNKVIEDGVGPRHRHAKETLCVGTAVRNMMVRMVWGPGQQTHAGMKRCVLDKEQEFHLLV